MKPRLLTTRDVVALKKAISYIKPFRAKYALTVGCTVASLGLGLAQPLLFGYLVDALVQSKTHDAILVVFIMAIAYLMQTVISLGETYLTIDVSNGIIHNIKEDLYRQLLSLPIKAFDRMHAGELLNRLEGDVGVLSEIIVRRSMSVLVDIGRLIGTGIMLFRLNLGLTLVILVAFPLSIIVFGAYGRILRELNFKAKKMTDGYYSLLNEVISGIREIKSLTIEGKVREKLVAQNAALIRMNVKASKMDARAALVNMLVGGASLFGVMLMGVSQLGRHLMSLGDFVAFYTYAGHFYGAMRNVTEINSTIQSSLVAIDRIVSMLAGFGLSLDRPEDYSGMVPPNGPVRICLESVSFSYDGCHEILDGISFVAEPRSITAIVGRNGSGKTTIFNLMLRFYEPSKGSINYGGIDLQSLDIHQLRKSIAILHQQPFLFQGTIRENLLQACEDADEKTLVAATSSARIHDFIQSLPRGYDTVIGGEELKLSPGLQRRLAIARALVRRSPVLLLDELTDSLDGEAELSMVDLLRSLAINHTILVVTHCLSVVKAADKIVVIDGGRKVAEGDHHGLLVSCPQYRALFDRRNLDQHVTLKEG